MAVVVPETFAPELAAWLAARRPALHLDARRPLALDDSGAVWLVAAGSVDLFAVVNANGSGPGRHHHLFLAEAGCLLFGLRDDLGLMGLVAKPGPDTVLLPADIDDLEAFGADGPAARDLATGIDRWVAGMSAALVRPIAQRPRPERLLAPGERATVKKGACLGARGGAVWLALPAGAATLANLEPVPAAPARTAPLARSSWLTLGAATEVTAMATADLVADGRWRVELEGFHTAVLNCLPVNLRLADVDEAHRTAARDARHQLDVDRIAAELASLSGLAVPPPRGADTAEELFSAMTEIGKAIFHPVRRPLKLRQEDADVLPTLEEIVAASGLRSRRVRLEDDWWRDGDAALLCRRIDDGRPVAVVRRLIGGARLFDPCTAAWSRLDAQAAAGLEPEAHVFFRPFPDRKLTFSNIVAFGLDLCTDDLATVALVSLAGTLLGVGLPTASTFLLGTVIPDQLTDLLTQVALAIAAVAAGTAVLSLVSGRAMQRVQARAGAGVKAAVWDRVLRSPSGFLARFSAGDLAARAAALEGMLAGVRTTAGALAMAAITGLSSLVTLFVLEWRAGLLAVGVIGVLALSTAVTIFLQRRAFNGGEAADGLVQSFVIEMLNGIAKIRLAGAEARAFVRWGHRFTRLRAKTIAARRVQNGYAAFLAGFDIIKLAAMFAVVALLNQTGMPPAGFVGALIAFGMVTTAAAQAAQLLLGLSFQLAAVPYIEPLLTQVPEAPGAKANPGSLSGAVELANVVFRYAPDQPAVLSGVSLTLAPGEFVAIVGPSGCGKSTLIRLLLGFEKPSSGLVTYDERDLQGLDVNAVRRQIGTVLQGAKLMPGTVFENIRGATGCTQEDAWRAADMAGIAADIRAMPMGMHTLVTDAGRQFSGGQVQRLAIARAVVSRPPILIFDEATSALDNRAQAHVTQALASLAATRVVVAHRLSTITGADRILVLDRGQIVEQGTFKELMKRNGLFSRLARRQMA